MRITTGMLSDGAVRNLQANYASLAEVQEQVTSGRRLNRPSDDPAAIRTSRTVRESRASLEHNLRAIDTADRLTGVAEQALGGASDVIARMRELGLRAANGTLNAQDRVGIGAELEQLAATLVDLANTKSGDDYVFAGLRTRTPPYADATAPYAGDTGSIMARIAPGVSVPVNITADAAFGPALAAAAQLATELAAGTAPSTATLTALEGAFDAVLTSRSTLGAVTNRLQNSRDLLDAGIHAATVLLSELEDADMAEVISRAASRQATYEAALQVNAQILRRSLFDEL